MDWETSFNRISSSKCVLVEWYVFIDDLVSHWVAVQKWFVKLRAGVSGNIYVLISSVTLIDRWESLSRGYLNKLKIYSVSLGTPELTHHEP